MCVILAVEKGQLPPAVVREIHEKVKPRDDKNDVAQKVRQGKSINK